MSDRLVTDPREIADAMRRHEVVNADRVCRVCWQVLGRSTREPHQHSEPSRPAESGSSTLRGGGDAMAYWIADTTYLLRCLASTSHGGTISSVHYRRAPWST